MKWRDWDPPQYFNFRAYLDFGGGQITDLFTHWIDVVHMFLEQDNPIAAVASGGVYHYRDGRIPRTQSCSEKSRDLLGQLSANTRRLHSLEEIP